MGRRRKWRWKEILPYSTCVCFGRKHEQWQAIVDEEVVEDGGSPRRGGVSFDRQDKNAMYVRMLADVKVRTKPELARDCARDRRPSALLQESDLKVLEILDNQQYKPKCGLRFSSLHKVRRRQRPILRFTLENASILDTLYAGQAKCLLSTVNHWNFSMFTLDKLTSGRALFHITLHLFQEHNLIETFQLDIVKLMRCVTLIEEGYHSSNPYHNAVHAADVGQAMHCYLIETKLKNCLTPLETMIAIVSAITHDLDHPGVNQSFLIATSNPLAALYNNTSVLENHHWRSAMGILYESGIFEHFDQPTWASIERQLKSLILATDITRQQEFLCKLRNHLDNDDLDLAHSMEHRNFMLQIALKCADICNPCRPWEISRKWSELVCDEFFKQGDLERKLHITVTPLCDRHGTTVSKIQSGFLQFVVLPLFQEWYRFNPSRLSQTMVDNIQCNKLNWDAIIAEQEAVKVREEAEAKGDVITEEEEEEAEFTRSRSLSNASHKGEPLTVTCEVVEEQEEEEDAEKENSEPLEPMSNEARMELVESLGLPRRHSLPPPLLATRDHSNWLYSRRESFPRSHIRRHSLPVSQLAAIQHSSSFDKLVEKLSSLSECSPAPSSNNFDFDMRPRVDSMTVSMDPNVLNSARWEALKQTSLHGLVENTLLAQRLYTSEPHISTNVAQSQIKTTSLNSIHSTAARLAQIFSARSHESLAPSLSDNRNTVPETPMSGAHYSTAAQRSGHSSLQLTTGGTNSVLPPITPSPSEGSNPSLGTGCDNLGMSQDGADHRENTAGTVETQPLLTSRQTAATDSGAALYSGESFLGHLHPGHNDYIDTSVHHHSAHTAESMSPGHCQETPTAKETGQGRGVAKRNTLPHHRT